MKKLDIFFVIIIYYCQNPFFKEAFLEETRFKVKSVCKISDKNCTSIKFDFIDNLSERIKSFVE